MRLRFVGVLLPIVLALAGCGGGAPEGGDQPAAGGGEQAQVGGPGTARTPRSTSPSVGVVSGQTGGARCTAPASSRAVELAVEDLNANGGVAYELVIEDDASDSTQGITAFEKLINQDQVSVILGPTLSNTAFSTNPIAQDAGVPVLGLSNTAEGITEIATTCPRLAHRGAGDPRNGPGDQESLGLETLALLFGDDDAFTQSGADVFRQALEDEGVTIATEQTFAKADTDFSARLTEARNRRSPRGSMAYGDRRQLEGREILATMIIEEDLQLGAWHQGQHLRSGLEDVFRRFSVLANRRAARRQPVRRGAGDARDRACAARPPQGPAARRALDGAGAVDGRRGLPGDQARPRGRHGAADRAERPAPLAAAATGYVMETGEIARPAPPRSCCRTPGWWRPTSARSFD